MMGTLRGSALAMAMLVLCATDTAWAEEPNPNEVPGLGTIAPAFGLHALGKSAHHEKKERERDREPEAVQLDNYCGLRPKDTKAVLVTFLDSKSKLLASETLSNWYRKHHRDGLEIIVISTERNPAQFSSGIRRARFKFPVLDDRHGVVAHRYGVAKAPFTFLLDKSCRVLGFNDQEPVDAEAGLAKSIRDQLMGAKATAATVSAATAE